MLWLTYNADIYKCNDRVSCIVVVHSCSINEHMALIIAGNMMMLAYMTGLVLGSCSSYGLNLFVGYDEAKIDPCALTYNSTYPTSHNHTMVQILVDMPSNDLFPAG